MELEGGPAPRRPPPGLSPLAGSTKRLSSDPKQTQEARSKAAAVYAAAQKQEQANRQQVVIKPVPAAAVQRPPSAIAKDAATKASNVPAVPTLEELAAAPRFGLNARELILQAAAQVSQPAQPKAASRAGRPGKPGSASAPRSGAGAGTSAQAHLNPSKLCDAIAPADRPFVQYVPRSSIPRLSRQSSSDSLLGKYLALILDAVGYTDEAKAIQAVKSEVVIRKLASSAAAAHEASIYMKVTSKTAYTDAAGKSSATRQTLLQFADAAALDAYLTQFNLTRATLESADASSGAGPGKAARTTAAGAQQGRAVMQDLFGCEESEEGEEMSEECDLFGSPVRHDEHAEGQQQGGGSCMQGLAVPADDPAHAQGAGDAEGSSAAGTEQVQGLGSTGINADRQVIDSCAPPVSGEVAGDAARVVVVKRPAGLEGDAEGQPAAKRPRPSNASPSGAPAQPEQQQQEQQQDDAQQQQQKAEGQQDEQAGSEAGTGEKGHGGVSTVSQAGYTGVAAQVAEFVRGVLDPLYRAQLLNKQQYKEIVRKAVAKIMDHHLGATSAAFLLKEHESVRRYVMKLVEAMTNKA